MSNYETTKRTAARAFLQYDQEAMAGKFGLSGDAAYLYIDFLARAYRVGRRDGLIEKNEGGQFAEAGFEEAMTIYDILGYAREGCSLTGEFVNFQNFSSVQGGSMAGSIGGGMFQRAVQGFDCRCPDLRRACERLGGVPSGSGDVSYRIPMFDFFPALFRFWESDEEFPASANILFDRNAPQYMHYETMWYAASCLLQRLGEEMEPAGGG